jgi:Sulfotransferase domain
MIELSKPAKRFVVLPCGLDRATNRTDAIVWDEPFYVAYLWATGLDHPMRREVTLAGEIDWQKSCRPVV